MPAFPSGPITVTQLRERMGGALAQSAVAGHVLDADLAALCDENRAALLVAGLAEAKARARAGRVPDVGALDAATAESVAIPEGAFPIPLAAEYDPSTGGTVRLAYDDDPVAAARHPGGRYRYGIGPGNRVVSVLTADPTPDPTAVRYVWAEEGPALASLVDVAAANAATVERAHAMLQRRAAEHVRTSLDDAPTDY